MADLRTCSACGFANAAGAETCADCGRIFAGSEVRLHPGETLRDPDDLTLPDSPLLRAVVRGVPEGGVTPPPPLPVQPPVRTPPPSVDETAVLRDLAERLQTRKETKETVVRPAGFFVRVLAFLVDGIVLGMFGVPLAAAGYFGMRAGMLMLGQPGAVETDETMFTMLTAAWFVMALAYFTILHHRFGQTIGKSLLGLQVQTLDAERVGTLRSLVRALGYAVSSSFLGFGFLLVALTPRKRGWHDFLAGTCVVRRAREEASA